jgi:hypothetical protein
VIFAVGSVDVSCNGVSSECSLSLLGLLIIIASIHITEGHAVPSGFGTSSDRGNTVSGYPSLINNIHQ